MTRTDDNSVTFTCPRCMSWLKAPSSLAKSRRRCPRCQLVVEVPQQSRKRTKGEEYGLQREAGQQATAQPAYIHVSCHVCHTPMYGTVEQIGQELVCPDCGASTALPPPTDSAKPTGRQVVLEEYPLLDEAYPTAANRHAEEKSQIRVFCPRCNTMMYAEEGQVGQKMVCPDCGTATIVPRPTEKPAKKVREIGQYALVNEIDRTTGETPAGQQSYIVACCSLCQTRLDVTADQAGKTLICPDCGRPVVVPFGSGAGQGRWASDTSTTWAEPPEPPARPEFVPHRDYRDPEMVAEREAELAEREQAARLGTRGVLPPALFFSGTLGFAFSEELVGRTLSLMALAILTPVLLGFGFGGGPVEAGGGAAAAIVAVGQLLLVACSTGFLLAWIVTASTCGLAILHNTAYGNDDIRDIPNALALEGLANPIYLIFAVIYGALPGVFVVGCWRPSPISQLLVISISQLIFAPICLLSMLETGFMLNPLSPRVWRSVLRSWPAWGLFYVLGFALVAITIAVSAASVAVGGHYLGIVVSGVLNTMAWLVYFRLLGRLAWFCAGCSAEERSDEK